MKMHPAARRPLSVLSRHARSSVALLTALVAGLPVQAQTSAVPSYISYQGKVTTGTGTSVGASSPANRKIIFRIWSSPNASTSANLIYTEVQTVTISDGEFSVLIGQGAALTDQPFGYSEEGKKVALGTVFGAADRYLGITIDDGDNNLLNDPEISPRQQIVTSAFSFRAKYAEFVGANGTQTITTLDNGNVGIGVTNPGITLQVNGPIAALGGNATVGAGGGAGGGYTFRGTGDFDGGLFSPADGTITIRTDGTEKFRVTSTGNVGIGTDIPTAKLHVVGGIAADGGTTGGYTFRGTGDADGGIFSPADGVVTVRTNAVERMRVDPSGKVGIGTATASATLEVRSDTPEIIVGKSDGTAGALSFGNNGHGVKRAYNNGNDVGLYTTAGDVYLSGSGTSTSQFVLKNGGNVAIGSNTTVDKLNVAGNVRVNGINGSFVVADADNTTRGILAAANVAGNFSSDAAAKDVVLRAESGQKLLLQSNTGASAIAITTDNKVGIGTNAPGTKLDVRGDTSISGTTSVNGTLKVTNGLNVTVGVATHTQGSWIEWNKYSGDGMTHLLNQRGSGSGGFVFGEVDTGNGVSERMRIAGNGYVGIGTNSPVAPLSVNGSVNNSFFFTAYMDSNAVTASPNENRSDLPHSIITSDRIQASAYDVSSDARIKNVLGHSSGKADLETLMKVEITDYKFKDTIGKGDGQFKKVIAQQVEAVYPQAVTRSIDVIPDIAQKATLKDGWIELATDLKVGERVRILSGKDESIYEVAAVEAGRFRTATLPKGEQLFVYGRQVSDFRTVDYDALAMLNISATQQIKRDTDGELKSLRAENADLRSRLAELEAKDKARESRLASIEQLLGSGNVVMARPEASAGRGQE